MCSGFLPEQPGKILRQLSDIGSIHLNIGVQMVIVIQTLQDPVSPLKDDAERLSFSMADVNPMLIKKNDDRIH